MQFIYTRSVKAISALSIIIKALMAIWVLASDTKGLIKTIIELAHRTIRNIGGAIQAELILTGHASTPNYAITLLTF